MDKLYETLYDVLFQPRKAMREIAADRKVGQALLVFLVSVLIPVWALYFGLKAAGMPKVVHIIIAVQLLGSLVMWVAGTALWHLIAEFFGGRGTAIGLFTALGFAHIPRILLVPLWVLAALLPVGVRPLIMAVTGLGVMLWTLALDVEAIRGAHDISGTKAVLVLLTPIVAVALAVLVMVVFVGASLAQWLVF
jgi:hypothetical protein